MAGDTGRLKTTTEKKGGKWDWFYPGWEKKMGFF